MPPGKRATTEAKFEGPVWEWDTLYPAAHSQAPNGRDPFLLPVMFILLS